MLTTHRQRLRLLLSAGSSLLPALAWSQSQSLEPVLMRGGASIPVANTWYVDEAGNFVLMSESQRQAIELAQLPTPQVPLQSLTETASSSMQIPPEMLQQVMGWSAAMGGVAGGGLVGSLALTSGMVRGPEGPEGPAGPAGPPGDPASGGGLSAYEVAVNDGFVGSEQDWLNSLVGPTGATGPQGLAGAAGSDGKDGENGSAGSDGSSAYQVWVAAGNSGSAQDFLNSLVGDTGATGDAGSDGKSAYQIWIDAGNTGTYQTFLDSLVGATGATGAAGQDGTDGSDGASAYQVWLSAGGTGTEQDFLDSLVGDTGATGNAGSDGKSAYQIWIDAGNTGTYQTFLDSLVGATGATGAAGQDGTDGSDGASAYQVWLDLGNTGSQQDFMDSFTGPSGATGQDGADGMDAPVGPNFVGGQSIFLTVKENITSSFVTVSASAPDGGTVTFEKTQEWDSALFEVSDTGELQFLVAPDYEFPFSSSLISSFYENPNIYGLRVQAEDENGEVSFQDIFVRVIDEGALFGVEFDGVNENDRSGEAVAAAGDINADGFDDILIGASAADANGNASGSVYAIFGKSTGFQDVEDLSDLDGTNGFRIDGINPADQLGLKMSSAGDINADGFDDFILGTVDSDTNGESSGEAYLVFGNGGLGDPVLDLSTLNGSNGFTVRGSDAGDRLGTSVSGAGDINDDGIDDLLISDRYETHVIFGKTSGFDAYFDHELLDGSNGFKITGIQGSESNLSSGDVNGDGISDLVIGDSLAGPETYDWRGAAYVLFGSTNWSSSVSVNSLNGTNGFKLSGENFLDRLGSAVSVVGDINKDGFDDVVLGAPEADPQNHGEQSGSAFVVFGANGSWPAEMIPAQDLNGTNGYTINGLDPGDKLGASVSSAGDFDGDGFVDILIGTQNAYPSGEAYLIFGQANGYPTSLDLSNLNGEDGVLISGTGGSAGRDYYVSEAGDVNGDGFSDILLGGLHGYGTGSEKAGSTFLVFGQEPSEFNPVFMLGDLSVGEFA